MRTVLVVEIDSAASTSSFPERSRPGLSRALAGGKGHSLAVLARAGFAIPRTLVLTTRLFTAHVAASGATRLFGELARALETGRLPTMSRLARARRVLASVPLARDLRAPVRAALERLLAESPSHQVAVRSSAVGEDRAHATFAGLHDTFLGLASLGAAELALRDCWLSLLGDRALEYRARLRLRSPLAMAVVAQEHVLASAAGVAFSSVGRGDGARVVVELAPPGESAPVTGAATPERFEVPRVPGGGASRGDVRLAAAPLAGWLSVEQATSVVRQALQAEELLGGPADVEWLLTDEGEGSRVVLVQARPAHVARPARFDRTAVAESLPSALAPLARDFVVSAYARGFAAYYAGAPPELTERILVYAGGRLFMDVARLELAVACAARRPGRDARDARWREATEARARTSENWLRSVVRWIEAPRRSPPRRARVGHGGVGERPQNLRRVLARTFVRVERELARLLPLYLLAQDDVALIQDAIARTRARLELPLGTPPALGAGALDLARALARATRPLAARRFEDPAVRELLTGFGHRGGVELDLASPPLGEDLEALVALATNSRNSGRRARRPEAIPGFRHAALRGLLEHGRAAAARADRLRDVITRAVRTARLVVLAAGDLLSSGTLSAGTGARRPTRPRTRSRSRLAGEPWLAQRDDVFLLERAELARLLAGGTVANLGGKLARRRRTLERDRDRRVPLTTDRPGSNEVHVPSLAAAGSVLRGIAASGGVVRGPARVVHQPSDLRALESHEVLVAHAATADLFGALVSCAALVTDVGGLLSHGAILARELGVPAVVATGDASTRIATGEMLIVDGERGLVSVEDSASPGEKHLARRSSR